MTQALLAPVPRPILVEAHELRMPRVAFGSNAFEFWLALVDADTLLELPVLLYESREGEDVAQDGRWTATFERWVPEEVGRGRPEIVAMRPPVTDSDTRWGVYWIVRDLRPVDMPVPFRDLRQPGLARFDRGFVPHGPTRINGW
jgi:hypothetical protein